MTYSIAKDYLHIIIQSSSREGVFNITLWPSSQFNTLTIKEWNERNAEGNIGLLEQRLEQKTNIACREQYIALTNETSDSNQVRTLCLRGLKTEGNLSPTNCAAVTILRVPEAVKKYTVYLWNVPIRNIPQISQSLLPLS